MDYHHGHLVAKEGYERFAANVTPENMQEIPAVPVQRGILVVTPEATPDRDSPFSVGNDVPQTHIPPYQNGGGFQPITSIWIPDGFPVVQHGGYPPIGHVINNGSPRASINGGFPGIPSASINGGLPGMPPASINGGLPGMPPASINGGLHGMPPASINGGLHGMPPASINGGLHGMPPASINGGLHGMPPASINGGFPRITPVSINGGFPGLVQPVQNGEDGIGASQEFRNDATGASPGGFHPVASRAIQDGYTLIPCGGFHPVSTGADGSFTTVKCNGFHPVSTGRKRGGFPRITVKNEGIPPVSRASPQGYSPMPTAVPRGYSPVPTAVPRGYSPVPTAVPRGYSPVPTAARREYSPVPTAVHQDGYPVPIPAYQQAGYPAGTVQYMRGPDGYFVPQQSWGLYPQGSAQYYNVAGVQDHNGRPVYSPESVGSTNNTLEQQIEQQAPPEEQIDEVEQHGDPVLLKKWAELRAEGGVISQVVPKPFEMPDLSVSPPALILRLPSKNDLVVILNAPSYLPSEGPLEPNDEEMGNRLSQRVEAVNRNVPGVTKKKKKSKNIHRHQITKDYRDISECQGGLEIEDGCEIEEISSTASPRDYRKGYQSCIKAKRHEDYVAFEDLTLDHLPDPIKHPAVYDYIQARGNLVVHISVVEQSPNRKKDSSQKSMSHAASGFACICAEGRVEGDCIIPNCRYGDDSTENSHKVFGGILVKTNRHVIIDDFECRQSRFNFFYNRGSTNHAVKGFGYCLRDDSSENKDYVGVKIVVHDETVVEKIRQFVADADLAWHRIPNHIQTEFEKHTVVISHPHHWPKQVSFGQLQETEQPLDENQNEEDDNNKTDSKEEQEKNQKALMPGRRVSRYTSMTCKGSSGCPVLSGIYWNNPFIHSSGFRWPPKQEQSDHEKDVDFKVWGESYFY